MAKSDRHSLVGLTDTFKMAVDQRKMSRAVSPGIIVGIAPILVHSPKMAEVDNNSLYPGLNYSPVLTVAHVGRLEIRNCHLQCCHSGFYPKNIKTSRKK